MDNRIETLIAKEEIRALAQLYSRGVDRQDFALIRSLYTDDATDSHGAYYDGPVDGYVAFLEASLPHMHIGNHFVCNHLVSVDGDTGEGEVYAIAWHLIPDGKGGCCTTSRGCAISTAIAGSMASGALPSGW